MGCQLRLGVATCLLVGACRGSTVTAEGGSESDGGTLNVTAGGDNDTTASAPDSTDSGVDESTDSMAASSGCAPLSDSSGGLSECEADCGASGFDLEHISGMNYDSSLIHVLSPTCVGPTCPAPLAAGTYGNDAIVPCEQTPEALASPRGPQSYCKFAAATLGLGLEFGFTQPPEPTSITVTRPAIGNPEVDEDYVWHTGIMEIRGPGTKFNGDYIRGNNLTPSVVRGATNLSCLANLEAQGIPFDPTDLQSACAATFDDNGATVPLRLQADVAFRATRGRLTERGLSCYTPESGADTCCSACDHALSVNVAKYGVTLAGTPRSPNTATAMVCDPQADRLTTCRDFRPRVDRSGEVATYRYAWNGCFTDWRVPLYDRIRQTHPEDRPEGVQVPGQACGNGGDCADGQECIGTNAQGQACTEGAGCAERRCVAEWFVQCRTEPTAVVTQSYCTDSRFDDSAAGACRETSAPFDGLGGQQPAGSRLAECDLNIDGNYTPSECCQDSLGGEQTCDPFFQAEVQALERHDRDPTAPIEARCVCSDDVDQPASCDPVVQASCEAPIGAATDPAGPSREGSYALRTVSRPGGMRYREELDGFELRFAHTGNLRRAAAERCAEQQSLIGGRNLSDGWLAHDYDVPSLDADFDLAMCSGSTYEVVFAGPDDPEHVVSTTGDTLAGRQRYVIETADFLVMPGSGFPPDNLSISSCEDLFLRFTNKYDLSVDNQRKLAIWEVNELGGESVVTQRIAGGRDCDPDATAGDVAMGVIPCLVVDVQNFGNGEIAVSVDPGLGNLLQPGLRYRLVAPGLTDLAQMSDPQAYVEAFHDACGMPLISGDLPESEYEYDFTIDQGC